MSFQAKLIENSGNALVYFVTGNAEGKAAWYYVQVDEPKHKAFQKHMESGNLDLAQFGEILFSGWGTEAPTPIQALMQEKFAA